MLDDKRIQEAKQNVSQYLREGLLQQKEPNEQIINILVKNSTDSIKEAYHVHSSLWKIVISYYSMFYVANAVLISTEYKVGDKIAHKVTADAFIVYVKDKLKKT